MASYTANYQLHQWEPADFFLRTDFNADYYYAAYEIVVD